MPNVRSLVVDTAATARTKAKTTAMPRRVLSVDLGIRNLGLGVFRVDDAGAVEIERLERVDLFEGTRIQSVRGVTARRAVELLHAYMCPQDWGEITHFLIEKQPDRNRKTLAMQQWLERWGRGRLRVRPQLVHASRKMALCGGVTGSHHFNKKASVAFAADWIEEHQPAWTGVFASLGKKQDDAADALLQALVTARDGSWESADICGCGACGLEIA
jgi:hypothetical protein